MNRKERARISELANRVRKNDFVLDVGCVRHTSEQRQKGNLHSRLRDTADTVVGVDIEEEEIEKMNEEGLSIKYGDAENLSDVDFGQKFDVVVAGELIEHLSNPGLFMEGAHEVTRKDGRLLVSTPNPHSIKFTKKALFKQTNSHSHTCWFDPQFIEQLAERHGWSVDDTIYLPPKCKSGKIGSVISERIGSPGFITEFKKLKEQ